MGNHLKCSDVRANFGLYKVGDSLLRRKWMERLLPLIAEFLAYFNEVVLSAGLIRVADRMFDVNSKSMVVDAVSRTTSANFISQLKEQITHLTFHMDVIRKHANQNVLHRVLDYLGNVPILLFVSLAVQWRSPSISVSMPYNFKADRRSNTKFGRWWWSVLLVLTLVGYSTFVFSWKPFLSASTIYVFPHSHLLIRTPRLESFTKSSVYVPDNPRFFMIIDWNSSQLFDRHWAPPSISVERFLNPVVSRSVELNGVVMDPLHWKVDQQCYTSPEDEKQIWSLIMTGQHHISSNEACFKWWTDCRVVPNFVVWSLSQHIMVPCDLDCVM